MANKKTTGPAKPMRICVYAEREQVLKLQVLLALQSRSMSWWVRTQMSKALAQKSIDA